MTGDAARPALSGGAEPVRLRDQLVRAQPRLAAVRVGREHQFVGAGPLLEVVEALADRVGRAVDDVREPAAHELLLHRAPLVRLGLLRRRDETGAARAQAEHAERARHDLAAGLSLVVGGERGDADQRVRLVEDRRGAEVLAVEVERRDRVLRGEVVREGEGQAEHRGELGAESGGAEEPQRGAVRGLHAARRGGLDGPGDRVDTAVGVAVGEVVVEEAGQLGDLRREVVRALAGAFGAAQCLRGGAVGARGAPEAEVHAVGGERLQRPELLRDDERRVVGQHDAARAEADALGVGGEVGEDHGGRGGGDAGHRVVLGDPVAVVAEPFGRPGDPHAGGEGLARGVPGTDGDQVEYGERYGGAPLRGASDLVDVVHRSCLQVVRVSRLLGATTGGGRRLFPHGPRAQPRTGGSTVKSVPSAGSRTRRSASRSASHTLTWFAVRTGRPAATSSCGMCAAVRSAVQASRTPSGPGSAASRTSFACASASQSAASAGLAGPPATARTTSKPAARK
ncbi:putative LuxAB-like protein (oxygenase) [Streptomyces sp. Tu6071]|nr:putative LuxAB-like protein (oxygenase) [Streptomyces sp. Tu6071]